MGTNRRGRLLLVEDESVLRSLVSLFLRGEGFDVTEAADGGEGVERFSCLGPFDVVLLDLNLPVYPGVEVCRRIKLQEPRQRVIICSAAILDGAAAALEAMDVTQFLTKPYHPSELLRLIAAELGAARATKTAAGESLASSGTWRIDSARPHRARTHSLFKAPAID
jgi:two-component system alkaline phosphatase synthesis response regulator PhoP